MRAFNEAACEIMDRVSARGLLYSHGGKGFVWFRDPDDGVEVRVVATDSDILVRVTTPVSKSLVVVSSGRNPGYLAQRTVEAIDRVRGAYAPGPTV